MTTPSYTVVLHKDANHRSFGLYIGEDIPSGVYIVTIEPYSPASNAHIQPGDRVLAVNGHLVSTMPRNANEIITKIAAQAQSLTLTIQPTNTFQSFDFSRTNNYSTDDTYRYIPQQTNGLDPDLENYIKSLFGGENVQLVPASSSNHNEYILTSSTSTSYPSRPRRSHRKRHHIKPIETQTSLIPNQQDYNNYNNNNSVPLSPQRAVPSMGTPHFLLRNTQSIPKDNPIDQYPQPNPLPPFQTPYNQNLNINGPVNPPTQPPPYTAQPPMNPSAINNNVQAPLMRNNIPPPINGIGCREIHLRRTPHFNGFGFHLQYNKHYYIVHQIEPNSPAAQNGLRVNDIILQVNNQTTDGLEHKTFVQMVNSSTEITLYVQTHEEYFRTHPQVAAVQNKAPPPVTYNLSNNPNEPIKPQSSLSKAIAKFTNRPTN